MRRSRYESFLFDEKISVNIRAIDKKRIARICRKKFEKYQDSESIFIRCAILKLLREEGV